MQDIYDILDIHDNPHKLYFIDYPTSCGCVKKSVTSCSWSIFSIKAGISITIFRDAKVEVYK